MNNPSSAAHDSTGGKNTTGILASMCLALVLVVASVSALNLALPDLAVDLNASTSSLTWIADAYTVALAALVLPIGAIGDRLGRRNVLIAGCIVFGAAACGGAMADNANQLIAWRAAMGLGAAMIMPGTLSTITAAFPPERRSRGVSTWAGFAAAGAIIGLLAAGLLLEQWSWRSIFVASAVVAVVAAVAAALLSPNTKDEEHRAPDRFGAIFTAIAVGSLVFAIIEGNEQSWTEPIVIAALITTVLGIAGYAYLGLRNDAPLLDPRLFGRRGFRAGAITILVQFMAVFGFFFVGLQYLQLVLGYTPLKAAVALIPVALVVLPTSQLTPRLVRRWGFRVIMPIGLGALAAGMLGLSRLTVDSGYLPFLLGLIVAGLGIGLTSSTGTSAIVSALDRNQQGVASAMNDATREVGAAVGIALMGSVFGSHYRDNLPDLSRLPQAARDAAEQSPAGGLKVAEQLGASGGAQLADAVHHAFINGLSASLLVVGVILMIAAVGTAFRAPTRAQVLAAQELDGATGTSH